MKKSWYSLIKPKGSYTLLNFLIILSFTFLITCSSVPHDNQNKMLDKSKLIKMSPLTKMFLDDFEKEYSVYGKNENFIPSGELMKKYSITKIDDVYYISGLIKVSEYFNEVDAPGMKINTKAGNILTVNIPLNFFFNLIVNENINYLQLDEKVMRKNWYSVKCRMKNSHLNLSNLKNNMKLSYLMEKVEKYNSEKF